MLLSRIEIATGGCVGLKLSRKEPIRLPCTIPEPGKTHPGLGLFAKVTPKKYSSYWTF